MTASEVCSIISTSAKEGVTVLKFRDLHVEFGAKTPEPPSSPYPVSGMTAAIPAAEMAVPLQVQEAERAHEHDEIAFREQQLEELKLSDPLAFEEMLRLGVLEDDDGSTNDDA